MQPADLLDHVDLAVDVVVAVDGDGDADLVVTHAGHLEPEPLEPLASLAAPDRHAEERVEARAVHRDHVLRRDLGGDVDRARRQPRARELDQEPRGDALSTRRELGMKLLLKPRRGVGTQPEHARGAQDVDAVPGRHLEQDPGRLVGDLGDLATHDPGDPGGSLAIADQDGLGVEGALDTVECRHPLAAAGGPDDQLGAPDAIEVEGVQRLRGHQHHVVGDVDDIGDRTQPGGDETRTQPGRRRADRHFAERACRKARAEVGHLHSYRGEILDTGAARRLGVGLPRRIGQRRAGDRVDLAGDAVDAHAVDPVGIEVELEHGLRNRQHAVQRSAGNKSRRLLRFASGGGGVRSRTGFAQDQDPLILFAKAQFGLGQDHAVRLDPAQLRRPELLPVGHPRARQRDRDRLAGGDVGCPADDRTHAVAGLDLADTQAVGVWMLLGGDDVADHEPLGRRDPEPTDPLDLHRAHRKQLGDLVRLEPGVAVLDQPGEGDSHENCSRNRTSFSTNRRRSGRPCLSMAIRSIPIPNAKP